MLQGHDIICFSNDWDADPLSKKHIMTRLAARNRILWVNSIGNRNPTASVRDCKRIAVKLAAFARGHRRVAENLYVYTPLAIPFHGNAFSRWLNRFALTLQLRWITGKLGFRNPITWTFVPSSADVAGSLGESRVIYHCTDEFTEFSGTDRAAIGEMEKKLILKSDAVIVCSDRLRHSKLKQGIVPSLVTHGVDVDHFRKACDPETGVPADIAAIWKPIVGFFGLIEDWVDLDLIGYLARERPWWSFVLIGKLVRDDSPVRGLANVHLLGRKDYRELPAYAKAFDAAILPFVINELTLASNPLKLREYLAAGVPVVSSAIPEAERLRGLVQIASTPQEFLRELDHRIGNGTPRVERLRISHAMDAETWDHKVEELSRIVDGLEVRGHGAQLRPVEV